MRVVQFFLGKCAARPGGSSGRPTPTEALQGARCVVGGRTEASAPTEGCKKCLCAGRCGHRPLRRALHEVRRGGASGTPPPTESYHGVRRGGALPCPRATARVAPTEALQGVREKNPPVTASPCQPPLGKGAEGADCHSQCAHWLRNDMAFTWGAVRRADRGVRPYGGLQGVPVCGPMWASAPTEALQETRRKSWRAG